MADYPPLSRYVTQQLNAAKRRVAISAKPTEYSGVYSAVARAVVAKYPGLTEFERRTVFASLKSDADRMTSQTNQEQTQTLEDVSRILNVK
jgi:hypothetical protein